MNKYLKESILLAIIALPYVYLETIWNKLPEQVPIHFNIEGIANEWLNKTTLLFIPGAFGIGIYLLMLMIPFLDPKKKIHQMGDKYYMLRFMLTILFSLLVTYLLKISNTGSLKNINVLFALIGMTFAMFGNYFQTVRPNYFIGIRTPWTLENEQVWKKTHHLGGRLWMGGGIIIAALAYFINDNYTLYIILGTIIFIMVIIPIIFSYSEFKKKTLNQ